MSIPFKSLLIVTSVLGLGAWQASAQTTVYTGNGATGFGGGVGNSTLTITSDATRINFSLQTSGFDGNVLAIYLDTRAGGFGSTTSFTDTQDGGRTALSGLNNSVGRTTATFATGFAADFGVTIQPGTFSGLYDLSNTSNFTFVSSGGLDTSATGGTTLNVSFLRSSLGLSATDGFTFEASLISTSGYRSNETIGTSVTAPDPTNLGTAPNAGFTGTQTFSAFNTYGTPVPEPATWAAGGLTVLAGAGALRRRLRRA